MKEMLDAVNGRQCTFAACHEFRAGHRASHADALRHGNFAYGHRLYFFARRAATS